MLEKSQTPYHRDESYVFWRICYDQCTTLVSRVLAGRGGTLWLVNLLLIDTFVIFFTCASFQPQGCSQGTLGSGARGDICLDGPEAYGWAPGHKDCEQGPCLPTMNDRWHCFVFPLCLVPKLKNAHFHQHIWHKSALHTPKMMVHVRHK